MRVSDWLNVTYGYGGNMSSETIMNVTAVSSRSADHWTTAELQNTTTASIDDAGMAGAELNRTSYIEQFGELYDDFEHVSETYLLTTLAVLGILLNTVAMTATCRERHMRRMSRALHCIFFAAENLFLAGFVVETAGRMLSRLSKLNTSVSCRLCRFLAAARTRAKIASRQTPRSRGYTLLLRYSFRCNVFINSPVCLIVFLFVCLWPESLKESWVVFTKFALSRPKLRIREELIKFWKWSGTYSAYRKFKWHKTDF